MTIAGCSCSGIDVSPDEFVSQSYDTYQIIILSYSFKEQVLDDQAGFQAGFQGLAKKKKKDFKAGEMLVPLKYELTKIP